MLNRQIFITIFSLFLLLNASAQADAVQIYRGQIDLEINRLDKIDGKENDTVTLISALQTNQATEIYVKLANYVADRVVNSTENSSVKQKQLLCLLDILKEIDENNIHFYTRVGSILRTMKKVQTSSDDKQLLLILKSNTHSALQLIPFFYHRAVAEPFLLSAAAVEPAELLRHFKEYNIRPLHTKVLDEVARRAPMKLKTYLYSANTVQKRVKRSQDPVTMLLYRMVREHVAASKSIVLLNDVYAGKISSTQAHEIGKDKDRFFRYLLKMTTEGVELGEHSVDEALYFQSLKRIRVVNELHDASDAVRFASVSALSASEMYTLMVYSEDEIFTSTFLGMFNRMMKKLGDESSYQFLYGLKFNKFRTFIKMCAGYNVLSEFLEGMSDFEKQLLFKKLVEGLEDANDNLKSAVAVADTYGSMTKVENRLLLEESIIRYYSKMKYSNKEAATLYGIIIRVLGLGEGLNLGLEALTASEKGTVLKADRIFKDGKHVQQHFFFDDPDGRSSYNTFMGTFRTSAWRFVDKGTYVIIKSVSGKKVEVYVNKPQHEYAGQKDIRAHFQKTKRWPDVVVHRGHSYFANTAIESLTPNAEIVFLGSCGGYNNVNQVLNYSPEAQVITSKQIGTMWVNNKLCYQLNETIRKGKDITWETLWKQVDNSLGNGSTADRRFNDYIPPHKNLGALLIKSYRNQL